MYAGVQFRSRLEAKWAAFFDLVGWKWEYEPLDLNGYIPDFLVTFLNRSAPWIIEVKPALKLTDYHEAQQKIERSGWLKTHTELRGAACVGAIIGIDDIWIPENQVCLGSRITDDDIWVPWCHGKRSPLVKMWREAGNLVQWKSPRPSHAIARHSYEWRFNPETDIPK